MKSPIFHISKRAKIILIELAFFLIYFVYYVQYAFVTDVNTTIKSLTQNLHAEQSRCEQSHDWLELNSDNFLKTNSVKYFLDEKKLVMLITSRTGSKNKLLRIIFHSCTLNEHESIVHKFNSENTKLEMFFNIRQYQNYLLTSHLNMTIKN